MADERGIKKQCEYLRTNVDDLQPLYNGRTGLEVVKSAKVMHMVVACMHSYLHSRVGIKEDNRPLKDVRMNGVTVKAPLQTML